MKIFYIIYTILVLLKNLLIRKKHYKLKFVAERDSVIKRWYYDFPGWGFSHSNLEMVSGADNLCEKYAEGKDNVTVDIIVSKKILDSEKYKDYDEYRRYEYIGISTGASYINKVEKIIDKQVRTQITTMWICPVTLFVLGRYPNYIYIKAHTRNKKKEK
jgi:hypothetical protein